MCWMIHGHRHRAAEREGVRGEAQRRSNAEAAREENESHTAMASTLRPTSWRHDSGVCEVLPLPLLLLRLPWSRHGSPLSPPDEKNNGCVRVTALHQISGDIWQISGEHQTGKMSIWQISGDIWQISGDIWQISDGKDEYLADIWRHLADI